MNVMEEVETMEREYHAIQKLESSLMNRTTAKETAEVKIDHKIKRHDAYWIISGPVDEVYDYVAWMLQHDTYTPMYYHMRLMVVGFSVSKGRAAIQLFKTSYAGD